MFDYKVNKNRRNKMTKVVVRNPFPVIDRDSFLTPFDKMFDDLVSSSFPQKPKTIQN